MTTVCHGEKAAESLAPPFRQKVSKIWFFEKELLFAFSVNNICSSNWIFSVLFGML